MKKSKSGHCKKCDQHKFLSHFPKSKLLSGWCNDCCFDRLNKWNGGGLSKLDHEKYRGRFETLVRNINRTYKLSHLEYDRLFDAQGGVCAICERPPAQSVTNTGHLAVDHCHDTGTVRGLLCNKCNTGLGSLGDTVESVRKAHKYLIRSLNLFKGIEKLGTKRSD